MKSIIVISILGVFLFFDGLSQETGKDIEIILSRSSIQNQQFLQGNQNTEKILESFPSLCQSDGCAPKAVGLALGYFDRHGFDELIHGTRTHFYTNLKDRIASPEHVRDYRLPLDNMPPYEVKPDKSELPLGDEHTDNCLADFQNNSRNMLQTQKLDSEVFEVFDGTTNQWLSNRKIEYEYDASGNLISNINQRFNENTNQWYLTRKKESAFDLNGNQILNIYYSFDNHTGQYLDGFKFTYSFDAKDRITSYTYYNHRQSLTGPWSAYWKTDYSRDASGNHIQTLIKKWDNNLNRWQFDHKYVYSSDDWIIDHKKTNSVNDITIQGIDYSWNESISKWEYEYLHIYSYNNNGVVVTHIRKNWDQITGQWELSWKNEIDFDRMGNKSLDATFLWDKSTSQWSNTSSTEWIFDLQGNNTKRTNFKLHDSGKMLIAWSISDFTYDANNNLTKEIWYLLDAGTQILVPQFEVAYSYDSQNNRIQEIWLGLDQATGLLVNAGKKNYTCDKAFLISELLMPESYYTSNIWKDMPISTQSYSWNLNTSLWEAYEKSTYNYSDFTMTGVSSDDIPDVKVYPNPASEYIIFEIENGHAGYVELFDINGRKVISQELSSNRNEVSVNQLTSGFYFYHIRQYNRTKVGKVLVR